MRTLPSSSVPGMPYSVEYRLALPPMKPRVPMNVPPSAALSVRDRGVGDGAVGRVHVARFAMDGIGVHHEVFGAAVDAHHAGAFVVDGAGAQFGPAFQRFVGQRFGNAAIDHVHRAADRAAAVEQRGGTFQYFDLVGEEGFDRDRVVRAHGGDIAGTEAVAQDLHARAIEAAHDRTADAGAEIPRLHAGELAHGFAQGAALRFIELFA